MAVAFSAQLQLSGCRANLILSRDFFHNCLSKDPYPHSHPKYELHYILAGGTTLITEQGSLSCAQGDFLLVPGRCVHRLEPTDAQTQTLVLLFSLEGEPGAALEPLAIHAPVRIRDTFGGGQRLLLIRQELVGCRWAYRDKIRAELTALLSDLARARGEHGTGADAVQEENRAEQIEAYLATHGLEPDCSCEALARELGLSTRQVHRVCLQAFGQPFRQLLTQMRMQIAAHRLRTTDARISELAEALGYASTASFSAAYKRHFGKPPRAEKKLTQSDIKP